MLKATKMTLAAMFLAGSCGLAMAQAGGTTGTGGAAEGKPGGTDNRPAPTAAQPKAGQTGGMTQKNTGMQNPGKQTGQETGTAKDSASPGAVREESAKEQKKQ
jgi:hypothetical protein